MNRSKISMCAATIRCVLTALALASCAATDAPTVESPAPDYSWIDAIGERAIDESGIVGLAIAVAKDGETVYSGAFGHSDAERQRPATVDTMFDVASVGKQFTAAAILMLHEEGKLDLNDKVREYVPEMPDHLPNATIRQLLSHTAGFVEADLDEANPPAEYQQKRYGAELLSDYSLQNGETLFLPGETFWYSNTGYLLLGIVIERASGERYDQYLRRVLLEPLELNDVTVAARGPEYRMAQAINRSDTGIKEVPFIDMTAYGGAGSVCASIVDLLAWFRGLNDGHVIQAETLELMRSPSKVTGTESQALVPYGMAQRIGMFFGHPRVGHTGTFTGGSAALYVYPEDGLEIAVLSNTYGSGTRHAHTVESEIAMQMLSATLPDYDAIRQPLDAAQKQLITGDFSNGFNASFDSDDYLVVRQHDEVIESGLIHIGDLHFRDPANPMVHEYFLMDGDQVGWWVYSTSGSYVSVERRNTSHTQDD